ncbi:hypothetical protein B0T36_24105 [Nocardia donostiensis]|uniref:hypothetical protein n=1 Tax=Nocardia donostiensis TaxID=1538463 RepID=UPI0009DAA001|nr:hypothetical protein [Nocardia donostiensis]OQS12654.1 hypothetical protein B0T36_24105 [Nocardia donostiensis]
MLVSRGRTGALIVLTAVVVAGCGGSETDPGAETSTITTVTTSTTAPSTPPEDSNAQPGRLFTADPTIVDAHPIPITSWTRIGEDRIAVHFETGVPECYGVDYTLTETDTAVTVELRGGTRADAVGKMCVMMAVLGTLEIPLDAPLGDREVLG